MAKRGIKCPLIYLAPKKPTFLPAPGLKEQSLSESRESQWFRPLFPGHSHSSPSLHRNPLPCFPLRQPSRHRKRKLLSQVKDLRTLLRSSPSQCFSSARPLCCGANLGLLVFGSSLEVNLVIDDLVRTLPDGPF